MKPKNNEELAEMLAEKAVNAWGEERPELMNCILEEIPLAELIAVAIAAKKLRAEVGDLGKEVGGQSMDDAYEETKQSLTALEAKLPEL